MAFLSPIVTFLCPIAAFFCNEIESLKLDFHVDFFPHRTNPLTNRDLKTRVLS